MPVVRCGDGLAFGESAATKAMGRLDDQAMNVLSQRSNAPPLDSANDSPLTPLRFLMRSAEVFPAKTAIVYGARNYTYAQFATAAEALARAIRCRITPGDRVVFLSPNTPEMLITQFAVPLAGGVLIALNPRLAPSEVRYVLDHSEASLLFYDAEFAAAVAECLEQCPALRAVVEIPDTEIRIHAKWSGYRPGDLRRLRIRHRGRRKSGALGDRR